MYLSYFEVERAEQGNHALDGYSIDMEVNILFKPGDPVQNAYADQSARPA